MGSKTRTPFNSSVIRPPVKFGDLSEEADIFCSRDQPHIYLSDFGASKEPHASESFDPGPSDPDPFDSDPLIWKFGTWVENWPWARSERNWLVRGRVAQMMETKTVVLPWC